MHGLVNRSIEEFLRATRGEQGWVDIAAELGVDRRGFQLMRDYPDDLSLRLLVIGARRSGAELRDLCDDLGAWLALLPALRRLLRFGGEDFVEFLWSLSELPGRARMVIPGLNLPAITVTASGDGWHVAANSESPLWLDTLAGLLRAMADDYGVLAVISRAGLVIEITVPLSDFAEARPFSIADDRP